MRDVRVVELAGSVAGAYCGRMFATTGSDVVLVEPTGGAPTRALAPFVEDEAGATRSAVHEHLDAGKRSVEVDIDGPDGDAVLRWADLVILTVDGDPRVAFDLRARLARIAPRDGARGRQRVRPHRPVLHVAHLGPGRLGLRRLPVRQRRTGTRAVAGRRAVGLVAHRRDRRGGRRGGVDRRGAHGDRSARRRRQHGGRRLGAPVELDDVHPHRRRQGARRDALRELPPAGDLRVQGRVDHDRLALAGAVRGRVHRLRGVGPAGRPVPRHPGRALRPRRRGRRPPAAVARRAHRRRGGRTVAGAPCADRPAEQLPRRARRRAAGGPRRVGATPGHLAVGAHAPWSVPPGAGPAAALRAPDPAARRGHGGVPRRGACGAGRSSDAAVDRPGRGPRRRVQHRLGRSARRTVPRRLRRRCRQGRAADEPRCRQRARAGGASVPPAGRGGRRSTRRSAPRSSRTRTRASASGTVRGSGTR